MKTELTVKLLQHLCQKKQDEGFTLIELLVVIIIIGILSAIALPSMLSHTGKAKQAEAKQNIGIVNRAQVAYRTEYSQFAASFDALAIGSLAGSSNVTTTNYSYTIVGGTDTATIIATARDTTLKAYSGGNSRNTSVSNDTVIASIICEAITPGTTAADAPLVSTSADPACPSNYENLNQ